MAGTRAAWTVITVLALAACGSGAGTPGGASTQTPTATTSPSRSNSSAPGTPGTWRGRPRRLVVRTIPAGAAVEVVDATGARQRGGAPYTAVVRGARVAVTIRRPGYNGLRSNVVVGRGRVLTVWLYKRGQLVSTLARWKTGSNPKQVAFTPDGRPHRPAAGRDRRRQPDHRAGRVRRWAAAGDLGLPRQPDQRLHRPAVQVAHGR